MILAKIFDDRAVWVTKDTLLTWDSKENPNAPDPDLLRFIFEKMQSKTDPVVLDVGGHTGMVSLMAAFYHKMIVHTFEPAPITYDILYRNIKLNELESRVHPYNIALSDICGTASLKFPKKPEDYGLANIGSPSRMTEWDPIDVETYTIDTMSMKKNIKDVTLIKIDVEGAELKVLQGGSHIITEYHPDIILEFNSANTKQFGYHPNKITELLKSLGYNDPIKCGSEDIYYSYGS